MPAKKLIIPREKYLSAGVHIGLAARTADMKRFIYKIRDNGMAVLNIGLLDKRISYAANMIAGANNVLVVSRKEIGRTPAKKLAEHIGAKAITGRFMPGSLTNPSYRDFFEPGLVIITDPIADSQVMKEAINMRIPIISLADTYNYTSYIDLVLPCNNKGKKSIALVYWAIAKLLNEKKGNEFSASLEDFGFTDAKIDAEEEVQEEEEITEAADEQQE